MHQQKGFIQCRLTSVPYIFFFFFFHQSCYTNNLSVPRMCVFDNTEAWRAIGEPIQHVRAANETCIWTGFRVRWWCMHRHCSPSLQRNKEPLATEAGVCRHTSQTVTLFMHALNLIVASATLGPPALSPPPPPFPLLLCHADSIACATMCDPLQMKN